MFSDIIAKGATLLVLLYIAFVLWPKEFGLYSFVMSFIGTLILLVDFGLLPLTIRQSTQHPETQTAAIQKSCQLKIYLACGATVILALYAFMFGAPHVVLYLNIFFGVSVINSYAEYIRALHRIHQHMQREALIKIINGVCMIICSAIVARTTPSILSFLWWLLLASGIHLGVSRRYTRQLLTSPRQLYTITSLLKRGKQAFPIGISNILVALYISADQVILGQLGQYTALGEYAFAYKITLMYTSLSAACFHALLPITSRGITPATAKARYLHGCKRILWWNTPVILFCMCMTYLLIASGRSVLGAYTPSLAVLIILRIYCRLEPLSNRWYTCLMSLQKDHINVWWLACTAVINVGCNLLLIPHYGYRSAARTTVGSYLLYTLFCAFYLTRSTWNTSKG